MKSDLKKYWLAGFCILVLLMISVGGITRLTRSGLSIVEWKPISGIIPPITEAQWQEQFELYKQTPEFVKVNSHFELSDYKQIFLWEYVHRVLGRIIFLYVLFPGIWLWRKNLVAGKIVFSLAALVAVQGLIGWLMVKSGLNVKPHVSPFMLALHFFAALTVMVTATYYYFKSRPVFAKSMSIAQLRSFKIFGIFLGIQIFYGCLVGGMKAGIGYNTYPLMNGQFFPEGGLFFSPVWINFFENPATVQWIHRWFAMATLASFLIVIRKLASTPQWSAYSKSIYGFMAAIFLQITVGILTLVYVVPVSLAAFHQFVAAVLVFLYFRILFNQSVITKEV